MLSIAIPRKIDHCAHTSTDKCKHSLKPRVRVRGVSTILADQARRSDFQSTDDFQAKRWLTSESTLCGTRANPEVQHSATQNAGLRESSLLSSKRPVTYQSTPARADFRLLTRKKSKA